MANTERITCDYADCENLYAYRIHGFNLCTKHCFGDDPWWKLMTAFKPHKFEPWEDPTRLNCIFCKVCKGVESFPLHIKENEDGE